MLDLVEDDILQATRMRKQRSASKLSSIFAFCIHEISNLIIGRVCWKGLVV